MRTVLRAAIALGVLGLLLGTAPPAGAHAVLESSQPADGSSSDVAPTTVELTFDEAIDTRTVTLSLHTGKEQTLRLVITPTGPSTTVHAAVPPLDHGAYDLRWSAVSVDDHHQVTGSVAFGVGAAVVPAGVGVGPMPPLADVARQWGLLAVTAAVVAVLVIVLGRRRGVLGSSGAPNAVVADRWCSDVMLGLGVTGATLGLLPASGRSLTLTGVAGIPGVSVPGWALVVLGSIVVGVAGRSRRGLSSTAAAAGLLAIVLGQVVDSHVRGGWGWGLVLGVHLLAATAWVALVATLVVAGVLERRGAVTASATTTGATTATRWRAATGPAVTFGVIVVATGLLLAGRETASLDAVLRTTYGHWLLVKTALLTLAVLAGWAAWRRRRGVSEPRRARGRGELAALTLALGAAAALSLSAPATGPGFAPTQQAQRAPVAEPVADVFLTADLTPDVPGPVVLRVGISEVRHPGPGVPTAVTADLVGPHGVPSVHRDLEAVDAGHWSSSDVQIDTAGSWSITLRVVRPGVPDVVWNGPWLVASPVGSAPEIISAAPWSGVLDTTAVLFAAVAAVGGVVVLRRGRRPRSDALVVAGDPTSPDTLVVPTDAVLAAPVGVR